MEESGFASMSSTTVKCCISAQNSFSKILWNYSSCVEECQKNGNTGAFGVQGLRWIQEGWPVPIQVEVQEAGITIYRLQTVEQSGGNNS